MLVIPILSPAQAAEWDRTADTAGIALATLMETAGRAAAAVLVTRWPDRVRIGTLVAAGTGNNGGDGWVLARALHRLGLPVWVAAAPGEASPLAGAMAALARADGVREVAPDGPWPTVGAGVDALLGTGARGAPRAPVAALVQRLADLRVPLLAVDGPTGVDLGSGVVHAAAVPAECSVTFGGLRRGHLLARDEVGDVIVADIGHPAPAAEWPRLVTDALAASFVPPLRADDHKGTRGRVVVIGGDAGMTGAVRMTARGAFAAGAGLVHVVAPAESVAVLAGAEPDVQTLAHDFAAPLAAPLRELLARADAVVIGPGLGRSAARREFVAAVAELAKRLVLDADALAVHADDAETIRRIAAGRPTLITPHPGEFRMLFPAHAGGAEVDPWHAAEAAAADAGCAVLLKGVPTVVAAEGSATLTSASGNPGLATGGSGDVLAGIAGAMLARGVAPVRAGAAAAHALGRAAEVAARRIAPRAVRPSDIVAALATVWREWTRALSAPAVPRPPAAFILEAPRRD